MSEVNRYWIDIDGDISLSDHGHYVLYEDYEKLKTELAFYKNGTQIKEIHYDEHLSIELEESKKQVQELVQALEEIAALAQLAHMSVLLIN